MDHSGMGKCVRTSPLLMYLNNSNPIKIYHARLWKTQLPSLSISLKHILIAPLYEVAQSFERTTLSTRLNLPKHFDSEPISGILNLGTFDTTRER